jgi:TetR/AcrR family transcriptional regulator
VLRYLSQNAKYHGEDMQQTFLKLPSNRQEAILDASAWVFAEMGYSGSNIPSICRRAGVSTGALYKYFKNKEALFRAVLDHGVDIIHSYYDKFETSERPVFDSIRDLFLLQTPFAEKYRPYLIIYIDIGSSSMNAVTDYISDRVENIGRDFFYKLINEGKKRGEINKRIDSVHAAYMIDNYVTLNVYSLVSEHYRKRFDRFFFRVNRHLSQEQRIDLIIKSIRMLKSISMFLE